MEGHLINSIYRLLGQANGYRGAGSDGGRQLYCFFQVQFHRHYAIDQAMGQRLFGAEETAV